MTITRLTILQYNKTGIRRESSKRLPARSRTEPAGRLGAIGIFLTEALHPNPRLSTSFVSMTGRNYINGQRRIVADAVLSVSRLGFWIVDHHGSNPSRFA